MENTYERMLKMSAGVVLEVVGIAVGIIGIIVTTISIVQNAKNKHQKSNRTDQS